MTTSLLSGWSTCTVYLWPQAILTATSTYFTDEKTEALGRKGTSKGHQPGWAWHSRGRCCLWSEMFTVGAIFKRHGLPFFCLYGDCPLSAWPPICPSIWWAVWVLTISHSIRQCVPSCLSTLSRENRGGKKTTPFEKIEKKCFENINETVKFLARLTKRKHKLPLSYR